MWLIKNWVMKGRGERCVVVVHIITREKTLKLTVNVQINQKENIHKATEYRVKAI